MADMKLNGLYKKVSMILVLFALFNILGKKTRFYQYSPAFLSFSEKVNDSSMEIKVGEKSKVKVWDFDKKAVYKSSDFRVAYVTKDGVVWGIQKGKAIIFVEIGEKEYQCRVTVK